MVKVFTRARVKYKLNYGMVLSAYKEVLFLQTADMQYRLGRKK
jgi:hypothetical protein